MKNRQTPRWRAVGVAVWAAAGLASGRTADSSTKTKATFKVAMLLPGSITDHGYNADGKRTADAIKKQLKASVTYTQGV